MLRRSATVVVVLSPPFFTSPWYVDRSLWDSLQSVASTRPDRVLVVAPYEVDRDLSAGFDGHKHFKFWRHLVSGAVWTIAPSSFADDTDRRSYLEAALDLTTAIAAHLGRPVAAAPRIAVNGNRAKARTIVYLAECTNDIEPRRLEIRRHLELAGFDVVPPGRLSRDPARFDTDARRLIQSAQLFVQLLTKGGHPHYGIAGARRQLEIAEETGCKILQWRAHDLDPTRIEDRELRELLLHETVREASIPMFCLEIEQALRIDTPRRIHGAMVFVDKSPEDSHEDLHQIFNRYQERYKHILFQWELAPETLSKFTQLVQDVAAVILYWGRGGSGYTLERYRRFLREFIVLQKNPERLLIYDGPPPDKLPFPGTENWPLVKGRNGGEPKEFGAFLDRIAHG
jgi:hypothetical protein